MDGIVAQLGVTLPSTSCSRIKRSNRRIWSPCWPHQLAEQGDREAPLTAAERWYSNSDKHVAVTRVDRFTPSGAGNIRISSVAGQSAGQRLHHWLSLRGKPCQRGPPSRLSFPNSSENMHIPPMELYLTPCPGKQ